MNAKIKKTTKQESPKTTGTKPVVITEATGNVVAEVKKVSKLVPAFGNGELNQVVEKLNEVIEVINKCQ